MRLMAAQTQQKDLEIVQEKCLYIKKNIYPYIQADTQRRKKRLKEMKSLSVEWDGVVE